MIDKTALDEVFPNSPLREVAFEIRYPLNLRIISEVHRIQDELGNAFKEYAREETITPDSPVIQASYRFTDPDRGHVVRVWENKFAIAYTKYETFERFVSDVTSRSQRICEMFRIKQLDRIGLRYINNIPLPEGEPVTTVSRLVRPYMILDTSRDGELRHFRVETLWQKEGCSLTVRSGIGLPPNDNIYVLDLDAFISELQKPANLRTLLANLHHQLQIEFLSHITEEFKQQMRQVV